MLNFYKTLNPYSVSHITYILNKTKYFYSKALYNFNEFCALAIPVGSKTMSKTL